MRYILVSTSPRRIKLMELLDVEYEVMKPKFDEKMVEMDLTDPEKFVEYVAERKCESVMDNRILDLRNTVIISADTMVYLEGKFLGKPENEEEAVHMLKYISGKWHSVFTGVCILHEGERIKFVERTDVFFRDIDERLIMEYVASGEPFDKAGAYGIQGKGSIFVRRIIGDYYNVMGFPVGRVWEELRKKGWI